LDITQLIKSRRSIRRFTPTKVRRNDIRAILDLARWTPSSHNAQPWRLIVIDGDPLKDIKVLQNQERLKIIIKGGKEVIRRV